jgi:hypothetical protein
MFPNRPLKNNIVPRLSLRSAASGGGGRGRAKVKRKCQRKHILDKLNPQQRDFVMSPENSQAAEP